MLQFIINTHAPSHRAGGVWGERRAAETNKMQGAPFIIDYAPHYLQSEKESGYRGGQLRRCPPGWVRDRLSGSTSFCLDAGERAVCP